MRGLLRLFLWLLPAALLSCSTLFFDRDENKLEEVKEPPRPTVNHAVHLGREMECIDCHDPEETGDPRMPQAETCFECHEDLKAENERVNAQVITLDPSLTAASKLLGSRAATQIGGCGFCRGAGHDLEVGNFQYSPSCA